MVDREEPDLVGLAVGVDVMGLTAPDAWTTNTGTSFSAPAVAGIVAILKEACGWSHPLVLRAVLHGASRKRNPHGWRYSTPDFYTPDWRDGAGGLEAPVALTFCGQGEDDWESDAGLSVIDLDDDGLPPPHGHWPEPGDPPPGEDPFRSYEKGERKFQVLDPDRFDHRWLETGTRIRAVIAWNACPAGPQSGPLAPAAVATDVDLVLYNETAQEYVYASQSIDDSTEGFDLVVESTAAYTIYISWPAESDGCQSREEPYGWAWTSLNP